MNILIIVADDLGWNDIGYHKSQICTPTLDSLAYTGLRLNRSYSFSVCTPTRVGLLSGNYPFRYGLQRVLWPWDEGLDPNVYLLSNFLKDNGYDTYMIGKWHLGGPPKYQPLNRGFDYHFGFYSGHLDYWNHKCCGIHDFHENGKPIFPNGHTTDLFTNKAIALIEKQNENKPFFMYLCYNSPHVPLEPAMCADWYGRFIKDSQRCNFAALVTHMDFSIGRVISILNKRAMLENTLIWFMSDNGGWLGQGGNNNPLRDGKARPYEGGIRNINFMYYKPLNSGKIYEKNCHIIDVFPTIAALINKPLNLPMDGRDIFSATDKPFIIFVLDEEGAVIYKNWKYIKTKKAEELYDVENDIAESKNIIKDCPDIADQLATFLKEYRSQRVPEICRGSKPPVGYKFPKYWGEKNEVPHLFGPILQPTSYEELICDSGIM